MDDSASAKGSAKNALIEHGRRERVRLMICGSVDDGKSTLLGRLLIDANVLPSDVLDTLAADSKSNGTADGNIDPSLLTDGLKAEREQGITIDVAHRFFSTEKRAFIVADVPGHEQYTRNMVTAASTADLAVILIDAERGITDQTRRHSFITSLLGVKHVIIAVNKMDSVGYDRDVFDRIESEYAAFAVKLSVSDVTFIPLSALKGDNVVSSTKAMPWYTGPSLLHKLETVHIASDRNLIDFRFPVQLVSRPDASYRGYGGTLASGVVRKGDEVVVLPSGESSRIASIDTFDGPIDRAFAPMSATLRLEDEIDVSRGDMIVHPNNRLSPTTDLEAMIVWMGKEPLGTDGRYVLKHTTSEVEVDIDAVRYEIDIQTMHRRDSGQLPFNGIGRCALHVRQPIFCDTYDRNKTTGAFILIDRMTADTVGAGMIVDRKTSSRSDRSDMAKDAPVFWLTGNSGSGKSTLAFGARGVLRTKAGFPHSEHIIVLDGDQMRDTISVGAGFSAEDRREHNLRVARLAALLKQQGFLVIVSVIAPYQAVRKEISEICDPHWIHVKRSGTGGKNKPYEEPVDPHCVIDNDALDQDRAIERIITHIIDATG